MDPLNGWWIDKSNYRFTPYVYVCGH